MKKFKIVAALCLIAIATVFTMSAFTGKSEIPVKKTTIDGAFFLPPQQDPSSIEDWSTSPIEGVTCGSSGANYCSFSYTTSDLTITDQQALNALLSLHANGSAVPGNYDITVNNTDDVNVTVQVRTTE